MSTESISNSRTDVKHSNPIPIGGNAPNRRRAPSFSSSEGSPTSPQSLQTPLSPSPPRVATSPSASPILSYFMSASPTKPNPTFPFRRPFGAPPVLEGLHQCHLAVIKRILTFIYFSPQMTKASTQTHSPHSTGAAHLQTGLPAPLASPSRLRRPSSPSLRLNSPSNSAARASCVGFLSAAVSAECVSLSRTLLLTPLKWLAHRPISRTLCRSTALSRPHVRAHHPRAQ